MPSCASDLNRPFAYSYLEREISRSSPEEVHTVLSKRKERKERKEKKEKKEGSKEDL